MNTSKMARMLHVMMPKRFPKRYLALGFAACITLMVIADFFNTPAEADALDRLYEATPLVQVNGGVTLVD